MAAWVGPRLLEKAGGGPTEQLDEAFGVTLDSLVAERDLPDILHDQDMVQRWKAIDELPDNDREKILYLVDGLIRDARARQAYGRSA